MNKIWKGLGVCTFLCMMTAAPSWADICFLPTGECEQGAQARTAEEKSCDAYIEEGTYYAAPQEGMNCSAANVPGCTLYECTALSCNERGFTAGHTKSPDIYPQTFSKLGYDCEYCEQGGEYWWKCTPKDCIVPYVTNDQANCEDGYIWAPVEGAGISGRENCGECVIEQCPEGTLSTDDVPTDGCWACDHVQNLETGKSCYRCTKMEGDFITASEKEELDEGCYTFTSQQSATGEVCYIADPMVCPLNQYVEHKQREDGKVHCTCQNYQYEFTAKGGDVINDGTKTDDGHNSHESKILHYTAAGGTKVVNVVSTQTGEETIVWPYEAPTSSGECTVSKSGDGATLTVVCQKNFTTDEKGSTFTIKQVEADEVSTHTIDIKIIIDPDTCENPNDGDAACSNKPGYASYSKGPRPTCYKTSLEAACSGDGNVPLNSGHNSIAGQACYYCVNDKCPDGYTKDATPMPQEGYLTETTDLGSNCFMEKPCDSGYSTDYQDVNSCTKNERPEGWSFSSSGYCGSKVCGKCKANVCTGEGKDVKCQASPFCNSNDASCGYKDPSTEYEGDTPKYNANIKPCPTGTSTTQKQGCGTNVDSGYRSGTNVCWQYNEPDRTCSTGYSYSEASCSCQPLPCPDGTSTEQKVGCGTNVDSGSRSGTAVCWKYNEPDRTCSDGFSYSDASCSCVCNRTCAAGEVLDPDNCTCNKTGCPEDDPSCGWFGDDCTSDKDCKESGDFPLYCFYGKCAECDVFSDCIALSNSPDRFNEKYDYKYNDTNKLKCSKKINGKRVRYAGSAYTLTEYMKGYKDRSYCTGHGECSMCHDVNGRQVCKEVSGGNWTGRYYTTKVISDDGKRDAAYCSEDGKEILSGWFPFSYTR